ncbi:hypothetical protein [Haloferula sp. BvORR071]|uniref:hypothetical protein n=1 Tax=Haloferula sp. BvORR071 TaxID=1396141 RepID=UPI0005513AF2|nr:hypothetical protein [Haloferula sp. BvORR071]
MKAIVPCTLAALTVGIATGWMLRGDGGAAKPAVEVAKEAKAEDRTAAPGGSAIAGDSSGSGENQKSQIRGPKDKPKDISSAIADEHLAKMMEGIKEQHTKRSEARIAALTEKLGLDAGQQAKLREYFEKTNPATTITKAGDGKGIKIESKSTDSPGSLEDVMKNLLSADQSEKYEEMKETERNQKIEARTLREMASLTQAVELRDDQRQAVYDILEKQARTDVEGGGAGSLAIGGLMAGVAPVIEFSDLGGGAAIGGATVTSNVDVMAIKADGGPEGGNIDHEATMKQMEEQRKASVDNKVNSLAGVLDASQLAKYRQSLEQGPMLFSR